MMTRFPFVRMAQALGARALFGVLCLATAPTPVCARQVEAQPVRPPAPVAVAPAPPVAVAPSVVDQNAHETREQLRQLLSDHPPALREVLQRDPGLLTNADYLAPYPRVAAFIAGHPEVARAPAFYLGSPVQHEERSGDWMWREMFSAVTMGSLFLLLGLGFGWIVRTALDHRRWQRVSKVQVETHSKILDRLTSSEDLRAYMSSPAGRQFLESAPIALDAGRQGSIAAPVARIMWSMQVGVVTLLGGLALLVVSRSVIDDAAQPLRVLGVLSMAIGAGFLVSAGLSYALSRHLGLFRATASDGRPSVPQA